ncbi:MAG: leucyl/phenylalanyl-tRNA--protein transferase [Bacteroidales bacterium]|nr:leucyl/phenylalanyl-tRNA--protein transferase [Bacteroidales bacterium]
MNRIFQLNDDDYSFPPANMANKDGLLAFGGDLSPNRLIVAYANGIFPWFNENEPLFWWSLDPRLVIRPGEMRVSKSLRHTLRSGHFDCKIDTQFEAVMRQCAQTPREGQDGTWITDEMVEAYVQLHQMGLAHSFEVYHEEELVGGLYGVALGKLFCGESMFHLMSDASKVAFYHLHEFLVAHDFKLIDCQQETKHLVSLGAYTIERESYLEEIRNLVTEPTLKGNWSDGTAKEMIIKITQAEKARFRVYNLDADLALNSDE